MFSANPNRKLYFKAILPLVVLISCGGADRPLPARVVAKTTNKASDTPADRDSCATAVSFPNAAVAEAMVSAHYTGELKNYMGEDKSKIDFIHQFENGRLVRSRFYYVNGKLQEDYRLQCGSLHGIQRFYYKNGKLAKSVSYRFGHLHGIGEQYDEEGRLRQRLLFENDAAVWGTNYDANGKVVRSDTAKRAN